MLPIFDDKNQIFIHSIFSMSMLSEGVIANDNNQIFILNEFSMLVCALLSAATVHPLFSESFNFVHRQQVSKKQNYRHMMLIYC
jgi:hypothetical protein